MPIIDSRWALVCGIRAALGDGWRPDAVDGGTGWCYVQRLKEIPVSKRKACVQTFEFGYCMASLADLIRPGSKRVDFLIAKCNFLQIMY